MEPGLQFVGCSHPQAGRWVRRYSEIKTDHTCTPYSGEDSRGVLATALWLRDLDPREALMYAVGPSCCMFGPVDPVDYVSDYLSDDDGDDTSEEGDGEQAESGETLDWLTVPIEAPLPGHQWEDKLLLHALAVELGVQIWHEDRQVNLRGVTASQVWGFETQQVSDSVWREVLEREIRAAEQPDPYNTRHTTMRKWRGRDVFHGYEPHPFDFIDDNDGPGMPVELARELAIYRPLWLRFRWLLRMRLLMDQGHTPESAAVWLVMQHDGAYPTDGFHITQPGAWDLPPLPPGTPYIGGTPYP